MDLGGALGHGVERDAGVAQADDEVLGIEAVALAMRVSDELVEPGLEFEAAVAIGPKQLIEAVCRREAVAANESKLGGARGGHRGPIILRVAAARVLPLLPVAARGARLVLSMGLAAGCVRARSSSSPLRGGHCPPLAASTSRLEVWLRCSVHVGCGTPLFRRVCVCVCVVAAAR